MRYPLEWIAAAVILVVLAWLIYAIASNKDLDYSVFVDNLFAPRVMQGLLVTFALSIVGMICASLVGVLVAVGRMSRSRLLFSIGTAYIWFFRGIPLLVQILVWGNLAILFPLLGIGIPFTNIMFFGVNTNAVLTTFVAATVALALHEGAYMAEVVRGGILAVDHGQTEAAMALGMTPRLTMRRIILPQALRMIIPPSGNQFIQLLKATSLVSVIAGGDVMSVAQDFAAQSYRIIESLMIASFWYLVIVTLLTIGQRFLERRVGRGYRH